MSLVGRVGVGLLLTGVVAAASTSELGRGGGSVSSSSVYVLVAGAGLLVAAGLVSAAWMTGHAVFAGSTMRGRAVVMIGIGATTLTTLAVLVLLPRLVSERPWIPGYGHRACVDAFFFWQHYPDRRDELFQHPERFCWSNGGALKMSSHGGAPTELSGSLIALAGGALGALIVGAALLAMAARHSRRKASSEGAEQNADVLHALDESLDDLRRERDVRRAIVACYARMERALASAGRERRAHETPFEFLRRILERVAHEPGQVLTDLFERARFSVEPMGEMEKRNAIAALEQLRARVAG